MEDQNKSRCWTKNTELERQTNSTFEAVVFHDAPPNDIIDMDTSVDDEEGLRQIVFSQSLYPLLKKLRRRKNRN